MLRPFHYAGAQRQTPTATTSAEPPPTASRQRHRRATSVSSPLSTSYPAVCSESPTPAATTGAVPTAASALLLATRTRTTSSSSRSRSTSAGNHRTRMGIGTRVKPDQSILVENHGAGTHFVCWDEMGGLGPGDPLRDFDEIKPESVQFVRSADELLIRGIGDYTYQTGEDGIVGKGKFSTVYKVRGIKGEIYALKHTPLYPHHPLISARLLREPTLLAQLPPHPCLIGVQGYIKTPDHIYLVEQLSRSHGPLSGLDVPIQVGLVGKILDQLVSVVRDGLHEGGRVCHRDLKADNLLIDETGHILLLDLGLATHFSLSKPRLTTCCGSPAYHSPEIVDALQNPPGTRTYYGPELDIWCIGLTILSLLTGRKYPIGTSHKSPTIMARGVEECLIEADRSVTQKSYERTGADLNDAEWDDWVYVKRTLEGFMKVDGDERMRNFADYQVGRFWEEDASLMSSIKDFKTISFEKTDVKHPLPIFLTARAPETDEKDNILWMCNPERVGIKNVISYIKYLLRTEGILYHCMAFSEGTAVIQCVLPLSPDSPYIERSETATEPWSLSGIFARRAVSVPPKARSTSRGRAEFEARRREQEKKKPCLRFWLRVRSSNREGPGSLELPPSPAREIADAQIVSACQTASPLRMHVALPASDDDNEGNGVADVSASNPPPQPDLARSKKPALRLLNIKSPPLSSLTKETCYPCQWPGSGTEDMASLPGTPGTPNSGCPWIQLEMSDVRAKEALQKALSQERWQSLGLEPLSLGSRPNSRAASRVRNLAGSRQVSGDSSRVSSPLVTPMLELSEEDLISLARGRGRKGDDKRGPIDPKQSLRSNPLQLHHDPSLVARRSRSARPSPPHDSLEVAR